MTDAVIETQRPAISRPPCPRCGRPMWLARIEPDKPDYDRRTFECSECGHEEDRVVRYN